MLVLRLMLVLMFELEFSLDYNYYLLRFVLGFLLVLGVYLVTDNHKDLYTSEEVSVLVLTLKLK